MILNQTISNIAECIGEVKENRVGIDRKNIDFITSLLTSNLYSKPLESFFRETIANAHDSHIEAGNLTGNYILLIEEPSPYTYVISIRDYGVGLSPERFEEIYKNIGSSTKRESNDFIGMFGIGRFSCLSCVNAANINSYYNGTKYSYVMYKNNGSINIDKVLESKGDYKNGLEVSIKKTIYSNSEIISAISKLALFEKLKIVYKGERADLKQAVSDFNDRIITKFKYFKKCSTINTGLYYSVGNVLYKEPFPPIKTDCGIIINLPIGSVDITPNRENLQYSDFTKAHIQLQTESTLKELQEIADKYNSGINSLKECFDTYLGGYTYRLSAKGVVLSIYELDIKLDTNRITIAGKTMPDNFLKCLKNIRWKEIDKNYINKVFHFDRRRNSINIRKIILDDITIVEKQDRTMQKITKDWILNTIKGPIVVMTKENLEELKKTLKNSSLVNNSEECIDALFNLLNIKKIGNADVPKEYIEAYKRARSTSTGPVLKEYSWKNLPVRRYFSNGYSAYTLYYLSKNTPVIYCANTSPKEDYVLKDLKKAFLDNIEVISTKKEYLPWFKQHKRFIPLEDFMFKRQPMIEKLVTLTIIMKELKDVLITPIHSELRRKYKKYYGYQDSETLEDLIKYYKSKDWINHADIKYFSLTDKEREAFDTWRKMLKEKDQIINKLVFRKFKELPKIGLVLKNLKEKVSYERY